MVNWLWRSNDGASKPIQSISLTYIVLITLPRSQGFAAPTNFTFNYPNTTGMSYSFTDDGYFEEAQYRFVPNGTEPHCVQAIIIWQHGNYTINANNVSMLTLC